LHGHGCDGTEVGASPGICSLFFLSLSIAPWVSFCLVSFPPINVSYCILFTHILTTSLCLLFSFSSFKCLALSFLSTIVVSPY
jgi:hypothetical protein